MANIWKADHNEGTIMPDWGVADGGWLYLVGTPELSLSQAAFSVGASGNASLDPVMQNLKNEGDEGEFGASLAANQWLYGPAIDLSEPATELWGSFRARLKGNRNAGGSNKGPLMFISNAHRPIASDVNGRDGEFVIGLNNTATEWYFAGSKLHFGSGVNATATDRHPIGEWARVVFHWKSNYPAGGGILELGVNDCVIDASGTLSGANMWYPIDRIALAARYEYWDIDNIIINNAAGSVNNGLPCLDTVLANSYEGEMGNTIYPAPERLPHSFSEIRDKLPQGVAQKLQENFEAIERQLLALDPDSSGSDPHR